MNTNFKIIGLTRLGIKPESTAQEQTLCTTRQSELLNINSNKINSNIKKLYAKSDLGRDFKNQKCFSPPWPLFPRLYAGTDV